MRHSYHATFPQRRHVAPPIARRTNLIWSTAGIDGHGFGKLHEFNTRRHLTAAALIVFLGLTGCTRPTMTRSGALSTYGDLRPASNARGSASEVWVKREDVLSARSVRILPTRFAGAIGADVSEKDRNLLANAIDRTLCRGLSKRFDVTIEEGADLSVQATITHLGTTNKVAAGASAAIGFIPSTLTSIPFISPRVPIGLGSLTVEAEALDQQQQQDAAMVWAAGANAIRSTARVSDVGDAYDLTSTFGRKFSQLLVTGEKPSDRIGFPKLPKFRGSKKDPDCDIFGRPPGILGAIADNLALPPNVVDKGRKRAAPLRH